MWISSTLFSFILWDQGLFRLSGHKESDYSLCSPVIQANTSHPLLPKRCVLPSGQQQSLHKSLTEQAPLPTMESKSQPGWLSHSWISLFSMIFPGQLLFHHQLKFSCLLYIRCHLFKDVYLSGQESEGLAMGRGQVCQDFKHVVGCKKDYVTGSPLPDQCFDAKC